MKVIKNDLHTEEFDSRKIYKGIVNAMRAGSGIYLPKIAKVIEEDCVAKFKDKEEVTNNEIDKFVLKKLVAYGQSLTASAYERYKTLKKFQQQEGIIDDDIYGIIDGTNEKEINENSNKDARMISTQRDLIAGTASRSFSERKIMPTYLLNAHNDGLIHIHDTDYMMNKGMFNCMLINLKDMLDNGTVINGKMIEKPKSFKTACTVATQISLQVANGQYGGQTFSVSHLAPYVRVSYNKWVKHFTEQLGEKVTKEEIEKLAYTETLQEIKDGVQTIQFQENTFSSNNGQTPFVSIFLYLDEDKEYIKETALIIEEMLNQRYKGMKNEYGVYITPAFPKLLYVLDDDNVPQDSEYRYLTDLAVKCASKRMNPDFISAKIMKEQFDGNVFPCMGCLDGEEVVTYKYKDELYCEAFERMWNRLSSIFEVKEQINKEDKYIDLEDVTIFDSSKNDFVNCHRIIKNSDKDNWVRIKTSNGRLLTCTKDHPLTDGNGVRKMVSEFKVGENIRGTWNTYQGKNKLDADYCWALGVVMCDGWYSNTLISATFSFENEDDIIERLCHFYKKNGMTYRIKEWHRGEKGNYKEVLLDNKKETLEERRVFVTSFVKGFEGVKKINRKIPNEIFNADEESRRHFLGGIIDSDGYIRPNGNYAECSIGSTNKELAIEELQLVNSLGLRGKIIENHYTKDSSNKIRYGVSFLCKEWVLKYVTCKKKVNNFERHKENSKSDDFIISDIKELPNYGKPSYDVTTDSDFFDASGINSNNCRSFLSPWKDENGNYKFYGRFNRGVVTINLVDVALSAQGDMERFWDILDERLELCKDALILKDKLLRGAKAEVSPIHWLYGAIGRLHKGETIDKFLKDGYSSISLGYIGVYEMVKVMIGESNTSEKGSEFAYQVMKHLEDKTIEWRSIDGLSGCSLYGTPSESLCYKFAQKTQNRFGVIPDITDKEWFTNSYHVNVMEAINAFDKLAFESRYQKLSKGGAVSYIEVPNMDNNLQALSEVVDFMYNTIQYAEINTRNGDSCGNCGYTGEIGLNKDGEWECPQCHCTDKNKLTVVRRTCGYIGSSWWNKGKTQEINNRVLHL